ncbi:MAG TPA: hypothetical protein VGJ60_28120 [Chloroflexota bacterium]
MDSSLDREQLLACRGGNPVYRLRRRHRAGLFHRLRCVWHRDSNTLATGLHAIAASIGIRR